MAQVVWYHFLIYIFEPLMTSTAKEFCLRYGTILVNKFSRIYYLILFCSPVTSVIPGAKPSSPRLTTCFSCRL